jgi:hypothetical protein
MKSWQILAKQEAWRTGSLCISSLLQVDPPIQSVPMVRGVLFIYQQYAMVLLMLARHFRGEEERRIAVSAV